MTYDLDYYSYRPSYYYSKPRYYTSYVVELSIIDIIYKYANHASPFIITFQTTNLPILWKNK